MSEELTIIITAFILTGVCGQTMIGNCNRTTFSHGATLCQRIAVENLVLAPDTTCESEYNKQTKCITKHIKGCLNGTSLGSYWAFVVDLVNRVVLNCGKVSGAVNPLLLRLLNCPSAGGAFDRTKNCWTDFAIKAKANIKDPSLCSVYATAKRCVTNITNTECPTVQIETDHCNPFCANRTDDHRQCPVIPTSLVCEKQFYFKNKTICEKAFIDNMAKNGSCGVETPKLKSCVKDYYKRCFYPRVDNALLDQLADVILSTSSAQRLFCKTAHLNTSAIPSLLRDIVTCNATFSSAADNCVKKFNEAYIKKTGALCRTYETSNSCLYKIQESHCKRSGLMFNNSYNPYTCENTPTPTKVMYSHGSLYRTWVGSIFVCILSSIAYLL